MADQWIKYYQKLPFKIKKRIDDFLVDLKNNNIDIVYQLNKYEFFICNNTSIYS